MQSSNTKKIQPTFLNRNVKMLMAGQFVSQCGDSALWATIIFLILALNPPNASFKAGFVGFLETFPFLLFGLFTGIICDRFDRRRVMWVSDIARAAILCLVPIFYFSGVLHWGLIGMVAFSVGSFSALFNPAKDALLPDLVQGSKLIKVNSFFQTINQIAIVAGTGLAAALLGITHAATQAADVPRLVIIFGLDAITFIVSAGFILAIKKPANGFVKTQSFNGIQEHLKKIFKLVRHNSLFSGLLFVTAVDNLFIMGPAIIGINILVKDTFNRGPEEVALLEFTLAGGMLLSSAILMKYGSNLPKGKLVLTGIILDGLTFLPFVWIRNFTMLFFAIFIHSMTIPLIIVPRTTLIQENIDRSNMAQAFSLVNLTVFGFWSLSGLMTGWLASFLAQYVGQQQAPPYVFLVSALGGMGCGIMGFFFKGLRSST